MSIAPISPVEQPQAGPARVPIGREVLFALIAAVVVAGLGAPFGLLWSKLAPHVELVQTQYGPYPTEGEPEGYWADDGWFVLMSIAMGILIAVAAWLLLRRYRGPIVLTALVVGSAAASVLGAWLGNKIGWAHYQDLVQHAPVGTHIFRPVKLRTGTSSLFLGFIPWIRGTMLVQALAAGAVYTGLAGFHASPTLRYDNMPPEYLDPPAPNFPGGPLPTAGAPYPHAPAFPGAQPPAGGASYPPGPGFPGAQPSTDGSYPPGPGFPGAQPSTDGSYPAVPGFPGAEPSPDGSYPVSPGFPGALPPGGSYPAVPGFPGAQALDGGAHYPSEPHPNGLHPSHPAPALTYQAAAPPSPAPDGSWSDPGAPPPPAAPRTDDSPAPTSSPPAISASSPPPAALSPSPAASSSSSTEVPEPQPAASPSSPAPLSEPEPPRS